MRWMGCLRGRWDRGPPGKKVSRLLSRLFGFFPKKKTVLPRKRLTRITACNTTLTARQQQQHAFIIVFRVCDQKDERERGERREIRGIR